jgi:ATP-dependent DNA helicase PIF1
MLRSDILEAIDFSLRKNGGNPNKKFGGKQLLFVGDIFQLPPVVDMKNEVEKILFSRIYKSEYFFDSQAYRRINPTYFEFKKSHRQRDDMPFVQLLDEVRICEPTESHNYKTQ